jgi:hypothetical protein
MAMMTKLRIRHFPFVHPARAKCRQEQVKKQGWGQITKDLRLQVDIYRVLYQNLESFKHAFQDFQGSNYCGEEQGERGREGKKKN